MYRINYFLFNKTTDALIFVKKHYPHHEFHESFSNTSGYPTVLKYNIKTKRLGVYEKKFYGYTKFSLQRATDVI